MAVIFGIVGVLGYVLITFIVKSIICSFFDPLTLEVAANIDTFTAPAIALAICVVFSLMTDDDSAEWYSGILVAGTMLFKFLPYSTGMLILCNLLWAGCVFFAVLRFVLFPKNKNR